MTATTAPQPLERIFRVGVLELADPDPTLPPEQAIRHWADSYPMLNHGTLSGGQLDGNKMVFEFIKPKGETKG